MNKAILCIGDSVTAGYPYFEPFSFESWAPPVEQPYVPWPAVLKARMPGWNVMDIAVSGIMVPAAPLIRGVPRGMINLLQYFIAGTLPALPGGPSYSTPDYVTICGGVNDLNSYLLHTLPTFPPVTDGATIIEGNLETFYNIALAAGITPVPCTLPPFVESSYPSALDPHPEYYTNAVDEINTWIYDYAAANGLNVIDFYDVLVDPTRHGYPNPIYSYDNIVHPNVAGYKTLGESIDLTIFDYYGGWSTAIPSSCGTDTEYVEQIGWRYE